MSYRKLNDKLVLKGGLANGLMADGWKTRQTDKKMDRRIQLIILIIKYIYFIFFFHAVFCLLDTFDQTNILSIPICSGTHGIEKKEKTKNSRELIVMRFILKILIINLETSWH